jgi:prepilin-type N-terminal cleavage/methylation domain-containing protein
MKLQRGLTLIEMVIAISLLAIMISAIVFSFDGSKSRAQVLVAAMNEYSGALERMKTDTSCYPRSLAGLIDRGAVTATTDSFCGANLSLQWNGPYVKAAPTRPGTVVAGRDVIVMAQLSPDLTLRIAQNTSAFGGANGPATWKWFIVADGIPAEILTQALAVCNGVDEAVNAAATGTKKCAKAAGTPGYAIDTLALAAAADGTPGSMSMLFAETRK